MKRKPPWEKVSDVQFLRLYKTEKYPDWDRAVNKTDLHPDWPRVVLLDLSAKQFREFVQDPLAFAGKYKLYPEQPIVCISPCATPPLGQGIPQATDSSRWTVVLIHGPASIATSAACPQETNGRAFTERIGG